VDYCREHVAVKVIEWLRGVERGDEKGTA